MTVPRLKGTHLLFVLLVATGSGPVARGAEAIIAVATNFSEVASTLETEFEADGEHTLTVTAGSTGKLYAQITNGAPFDVLLAADRERPSLLEERGGAVEGSRFVYATGRLALWTVGATPDDADWRQILKNGAVGELAIANPELAPYGLAARQTLERLGLWRALRGNVVMGENIGQTYALVATGNADYGFVALSSVESPRHRQRGRYWVVPGEYHEPVTQEAVLLRKGEGNAAAIAFLAYLRTAPARAIIESFGYGIH